MGEARDWQPELAALLRSEGYATNRVDRLEDVLPILAARTVKALFLAAGPLAASDLLHLGRIREASPRTAVVVVAKTPTDPDLKRAFESGATAFLSWPASDDAVRQAVDRAAPASPDGPPLTGEAPPVPRPESAAAITIHNRLHAGHRYRTAVEESFRSALDGLPGPWEVTVSPVGRAWFRVDVVAGDGATWSMSVPVHEGPRPEDLADVVRAACLRHRRLDPDGGQRRSGSDGGARQAPHGPSEAAPGGTSR